MSLLLALLSGALMRRTASAAAVPPPPTVSLTVRDCAVGIVHVLPAYSVPLSALQARRLSQAAPVLREALLGRPVPLPGADTLLRDTLDDRQMRVLQAAAAQSSPRTSDPRQIWLELEQYLNERAARP